MRNTRIEAAILLILLLSMVVSGAQKPKVWKFTDISAMAGYLLMCNMFDTMGIVITTHRDNTHSSIYIQSKIESRAY